MLEFNGHFDGKVITPDERVQIPVGMPLRVAVEPRRTDLEDWHAFVERTYGSCAALDLQEPDELPLQQREWAQ